MNYKDTLLMPKTDFEMRGNLPKKEPKYVERWQENDMYNKVIQQNEGKAVSYTHLDVYKRQELHIQREDEIGVLSSSLIEMKEEIDRQNEIKEEMIHNISHDLKTPIALIQTYAQSIKDDIYPYGDKDSSVDVILENTDRLEKKVKSLLYLNRLDYISGQIGDETCSMKELIEHIVFQLTAMHSQIEIITDLQDSSFKGKDD